MRDVSIAFQRDTADRPASNPSRKPPSVSPSGVLIDMPVTAIRSAIDKAHLHDPKRADTIVPEDLPRADRAQIVCHDERRGDVESIPRADLGEKGRMMNAGSAKLGRRGVRRHVERAPARKMEEAPAELAHRFHEQDAWIDRLAGKM